MRSVSAPAVLERREVQALDGLLDEAPLVLGVEHLADDPLRRLDGEVGDLTADLADRANPYVEERKPWDLRKERAKSRELQDVCTVALNLFRQLAVYLAPVLPRLAKQTGELLNDPIVHWEQSQAPLVGTGMERSVAENSGMVVRARGSGAVTYVDAERIVVDDTEEYVLRKFQGLNERTCLNQRPIVRVGDRVKKGQIIADGAATRGGELALGRNVLVAFMSWDGYNFEDAILVSEKLVKEDAYTSIHLDEFEIEIRETKLGREEFTREIPNVSERILKNLDEHGVVRIGTRVYPGDILVGKVVPKSKSELSPEEKLLHAIFGRAGEDVKNDSLEVPSGTEGVVIATEKFSRKVNQTEEERQKNLVEIRKAESTFLQLYKDELTGLIGRLSEIRGSPLTDKAKKKIHDATGDGDKAPVKK